MKFDLRVLNMGPEFMFVYTRLHSNVTFHQKYPHATILTAQIAKEKYANEHETPSDVSPS